MSDRPEVTGTPIPVTRRDPVTGTWWPTVGGDADNNGVEWVLRYGKPTKEQLLHAAEVVHAYEVLTMGSSPRESLARARRALKGESS